MKKLSFRMMLVAFVMMMTPAITLKAGTNDPLIRTDKAVYNIGDRVTVTVSNVATNAAVKVWYCVLDKKTDACIAAKKKEMTRTSNTQHYISLSDATLANKWIKIYAENTTAKTSSNEILIEIKPKATPTADSKVVTATAQNINADRWARVKATVYSDWNPTVRKSVKTIEIGTKVYVTTKHTLSNGEVFVKTTDGYILLSQLDATAPKVTPNAIDVKTPTATTQTINADRWARVKATVYSDWNPTVRKSVKTIEIGTKVYATTKYTLSNGEVFVKTSDGYILLSQLDAVAPKVVTPEAKDAKTPTATTQTINADRWARVKATVYSDWNPTVRKSVKTIEIGTKVYATTKYTLSNGEVFVKTADGYIPLSQLDATAPKVTPAAVTPATPTQRTN